MDACAQTEDNGEAIFRHRHAHFEARFDTYNNNTNSNNELNSSHTIWSWQNSHQSTHRHTQTVQTGGVLPLSSCVALWGFLLPSILHTHTHIHTHIQTLPGKCVLEFSHSLFFHFPSYLIMLYNRCHPSHFFSSAFQVLSSCHRAHLLW